MALKILKFGTISAPRPSQSFFVPCRYHMAMTGWIEYFTDGLAAQMLEVKQRGESAIKRDLVIRKYELSERRKKGLISRSKMAGSQ